MIYVMANSDLRDFAPLSTKATRCKATVVCTHRFASGTADFVFGKVMTIIRPVYGLNCFNCGFMG